MDPSRRQFLKTAGVAAAAAAAGIVAKPLTAEANVHVEANPDRFGVLTDTTLCIGLNCRRCEIACAKENGNPPIDTPPEDESVFDHLRRTHENQFTVVNRYPNPHGADKHPIYVKKQCMHCDEPACSSACFVKALRKTKEGPVVYDASVCVGCRYCMVACPFDIPAYEYHNPTSPKVRKCTMCYATRTSLGRKPACVEACPKEVMTFGKRSDLIKLAYEKIQADPVRYERHLYGEHEVGGTSWMFLSGAPFEKIGLPEHLGDVGLPEYPRNYLSAAPLVMAIWPALWGGLYMFTKRRDELEKQEKEKGHETHDQEEK
ncbi:MAG TPA: 4Fe-4S dicluster domain-containing protein [bacterium]